jgi:KDO2-lipid IV(A) lauroyltransferase
MKQFLHLTVYALVRGFFLALRLMPVGVARRLCSLIALAIYAIDAKHRRIGLINLTIAFPDKDLDWKKRVLRRSFQRQGDLAVELSRLASLRPEEARQRMPYEEGRGLENYLAARGQGHGVLFVTAHIGPWEILPAAHALAGHPLSFVVRPLENAFLDRWLTGLRSRWGNQVINKNVAVRRALKALNEGGDVGFLIDQNIQEKEGVFAPLFGRPACTTFSVAALALHTGAPVVPGFICPAPEPGRYKIRFYPPIDVARTGDEKRDLADYTALFNQFVEEVIREFPECWLWGHRRFQSQPDGSNPYA